MKKRSILFIVSILTTFCTYAQIALSEDFSGGALPTDWTSESVSSGDAWEYGGAVDFGPSIVRDDAEGNSGEYAHIDFSDDPDTTSLITPIVSIAGFSNPRLTFYYNTNTNTTAFSPFNRLILDYWDGTDWVNITVIDTLTTLGWTQYEFDISGNKFGTDSVRFRFSAQEGGAAIGGTGTNTFEQDMMLDEVVIEQTPTCFRPSDLFASAVSSTSGTIHWTENQSATEWEVEYGTSGFALGTGTTVKVTTDTFLAITGLSARTTYDYYVKTVCMVADSSIFEGPESFTTSCLAFGLPYSEGFNSSSTDEGCWTVLDENGDGDQWDLDNTLNPFEGDQVALINTDFNSGNNDDYLISPAIMVTGGDQVRYQTRVQSSGEPNDYEVLVSTTGLNVADFTDTIYRDTVSSTTYFEEVLDLSAYSGTIYVAFHIPNGGLDGWRLYIDNVVFEEIPTCFRVLNPAVDTTTEFTATINWEDTSSATEWQIEYGLSGYTLGTGTKATVTNDTFTTITGLSAITEYDWYIRTVCAIGDTSAWQTGPSFTTLCAPYALPYNETFDDFIPACWEQFNAGDPTSGPTNPGGGDWTSGDYLRSASNGGAIIINLWNTGTSDWMVSPEIDLSGGNDYELVLDAGVTGFNNSSPADMGSDDTLQVLISDDNGATWEELLTFDVNNHPDNTGELFRLSLDGYTSSTAMFGIWGSEGATDDPEDYDVHIGDFLVREVPPCSDPTADGVVDLEATEAILTWSENGFAEQWQLQYDTAGFTAGMGRNSMILEDTFMLASGLRAMTNYDYYVRAICPYDDTSGWSAVSSFTTPACGAPTNLGSFDVQNIQAGINWMESGIATEWEVQWDTAGFTAGTARNIVIANTDTFMNVTGLSSTTNYDFYVRAICGPGDTSAYSAAGSFTTAACLPVSGIASTQTTGEVDLSWIENSIATEWEVQIDTAGYAAGDARTLTFVSNDTFTTFNGLRAATMYDVYIRAICAVGDTSIHAPVYAFSTPPCVDPTGLMADESSNQAELSWTENGTATSWQVEYDTAGTGQGSGANVFVTSNNIDLLITGLRAESTYEYYVRSICGNGDTSSWSAVGTISTTICDSVTDLESEITSNIADLSWTENGTAIEWQIEYDEVTNPLGSGTRIVTSQTDYSLQPLAEFTEYHWYVRAICGPGDTSAWSVLDTFRTLNITEQCNFTLLLEDDGNNGWQGNTMDVTVGSTTTNYTLATGSEQTIDLMVDLGDSIVLDYLRGGIFTTQVSFTLFDADNEVVFASGLNPALGVNYADTAKCPSCLPPTDITIDRVSVDSAFLSWTEAATATEWMLEWDLAGFTPGTGANTQLVSTNAFDTITGLGSFTFYDVYIRAICGPEDTSAYSLVANFESDFVCPMNAVCAGAPAGDIETDYAFRTLGDTSVCPGTIVLNIPAGNRIDSMSVTYDMTSSTVTFPWISEQRSWLYSPDSDRGESSVTSGVGDVSGTFTYERAGLNFANKLAGNVEIELHAGRALNFGPTGCGTDYIKVDDGSWQMIAYFSPIPACPEPIFLTNRLVSHDSAIVSWMDIGSAAEFEIEWDLAGFTPGMGANSMVVTADTFATLNGLVGFSTYDYYVRAICTPGVDTSVWSDVESFTTLCGPAPSALNATDVTDVSAQANWLENGVSSQWEIEWDFAGFTAGTAANSMIVNTDTFTTLSGLSASSDYEFYVRAICAPADTGVYSAVGSFTTECGIPNNLSVSNVTTIDAVADWDETGIASEWIIEWDLPGFAAGSGANIDTVTATTATMDNLVPSTDYEFYVRAICGAGDDSEWSMAFSFTSACGTPPTNLSTPIFFDISDMTANINWEENAGASEWIVEYDVDGFTPGTGANSVVVTDTFTTLTALTPSTFYDYYVRSICGAGDTSAYSAEGNFKTLCGIPSGLSANAGSNQAEISFTETGSATEWEIQYGAPGFTAGAGTSFLTSSNPATITGLNVSTDYEFYVRAVCGIGDASLFSAVGSFTTGECDSVTNLMSANASVDTIDLSWTENGTAIEWEISYGAPGFTAGTGTQVIADSNEFTLTGLDADTDYEWYVRAVCNVGENSAWSDTAAFTTPACFEPSMLMASNESLDTVDLAWTEGGGAMEWEIEYRVVGSTGADTRVVVMDNPYTLSGLDAGTDYEWSVRAICTVDDTSAWSDTATFSTVPCFTPSDLSASNIAADTADISWTENGDAVEWIVEYDTAGFTLGTGRNSIVVMTNPMLTLTGLGVGTEYDFYVRAVCSADDSSSWSSESFISDPLYYPIATINTEDVDGVADSLNVYCWTSGIVMGVDLDGNNGISFYITDLSSGSQEGINVFNFNDVSDYVVTEGDSIQVRGRIIQFRGLTEINPDSIAVISTGNALPRPMLVSDLGENTESKLIDLYDMVLLDGSGSGSYNMRAVTHTNDTITIRVDADTDINDSLDVNPWLVGDTICRLVGVGAQFDGTTAPFDGGYQVFPMRFSDIDTSTCINIPVTIGENVNESNEFMFEVYPNPTNGEFTLNTSGFTSATVQFTVKDLDGRVIVDETINKANTEFQKEFNISENAKGVYFISVFDGNKVINKKLILQ